MKALADRFRTLPAAARERAFAEVEAVFGPGALADLRDDLDGFWPHDEPGRVVTRDGSSPRAPDNVER